MIGVAAAVQFAIFPVWFGAASVIGLPGHAVLMERLETFLINIATIGGTAVLAYALLGLKREECAGSSVSRVPLVRGVSVIR